jgi:hypothetical protein
MQIERFIKVRTTFIAAHCWPDAPDEVAFLRNQHRHIFNVIAIIPVGHNDRELEYFMVLHNIDDAISRIISPEWKGTESCEMIAEMIATRLSIIYDRDNITVEVNEDGENGSIVKLSNEVN